jgi:tRNA (mo5U34)-methyltransferase
MSAIVMEDELAAIPWFHRIDLGDGRITPGVDDTATKLAQVRLPEDLSGKSVLDIGAWDGFFSFEAERRGASRVVALDGGVWNVPEIGRRGFDYARRALGSKVEDVSMEVLEMNPARPGVFDVVFFLGVLYHMPHPLASLNQVASCTREQLILETHVDLLDVDRPAIAFYRQDDCANDSTNWCGPNRGAVEEMLRTVGFSRVVSFPPVTDVHYPVRGAKPGTFGRMVFHAWK